MLVSSSSREGRNSKHEGERRPASNFLFGKEAFITSNLAPFLATSSRSPAPKDGPGQLFLGPPGSYEHCVHTGILPSITIFCQFLLFFLPNFAPNIRQFSSFGLGQATQIWPGGQVWATQKPWPVGQILDRALAQPSSICNKILSSTLNFV